jgi:poly-gamma-glutamate capsule biosynthesis protein CapA/YwtB (metallophosphatase superfamily)
LKIENYFVFLKQMFSRKYLKKQRIAGRATSLWRGLALASLLSLVALPAARGEEAAPADGFTFAAGGDIIGPRGPLTEAMQTDFRQIADLFRNADVGMANLEGAVFDLSTLDGYPAAENGGGYPLYPMTLLGELRDMGITLVSKANNHATDWGVEGLAATLQSLAAAGITQAGTGMSLAEARAPAHVETSHGRAALVSTATTFPPMSVAGGTVTRFGVESAPRPGISALRIRKVRLVEAADLEALRRIGGPITREVEGQPDEVRVDDQVFRAADGYGFEWEINPEDEAAVLDSIRQADANADFVAFMIHTHETAGNEDDIPLGDYELAVLHRANEVPSPDEPTPAAFQPVLFHEAIDAGADAVIRTGPHVLGGIEIYRDRPIYYSLGSLFLLFCGNRTYQAPSGQIKKLPDDWYDTVIPVTRYADGRLAEIRLYPAVIQSEPGPLCSVPRPADAEEAARILGRIRKLSAAFGTTVAIRDGIGVVTP